MNPFPENDQPTGRPFPPKPRCATTPGRLPFRLQPNYHAAEEDPSMPALAVQHCYTPKDLLTMPEGERFELVDGRLVEKKMGAESSWIANLLAVSITQFVQRHGLGWVFNSECGYQCFPNDPHRVRKPDVSFVARGRLPGDSVPGGHISVAPDLAVEGTSPNDHCWRVRGE